MKNFQMSEQQLQQILSSLGECPAKFVFSVIDVLRNLPEVFAGESEEKINEFNQ